MMAGRLRSWPMHLSALEVNCYVVRLCMKYRKQLVVWSQERSFTLLL